MNPFKCLIAGMLTMTLTHVSFAGKVDAPLMQEQAFQKTASVLPAGARLVAGNPKRNEFYILGRMTPEEAATVTAKPHLKAKPHKAKAIASKKTKRIASKRKIKHIASKHQLKKIARHHTSKRTA